MAKLYGGVGRGAFERRRSLEALHVIRGVGVNILNGGAVTVSSVVLHGLSSSSADGSFVLEPVDHSVETQRQLLAQFQSGFSVQVLGFTVCFLEAL